MISIKHYKPATVLVAIAALVGMLAVSTVAIGSVHKALADDAKTITKTIRINNTGVNTPQDTNQKQECQTAGETSAITNSCTASSSNSVMESGGLLKK
jgi:hypothetical protein